MIHVCFYDVSNTIIWSGRHQILSESSAVSPSVCYPCCRRFIMSSITPPLCYQFKITRTHSYGGRLQRTWKVLECILNGPDGWIATSKYFFHSNGNMRGKRCFEGTIKDTSKICEKLLIIVIYFSPGWSIGLTRSDSSFGISANMSPDGRPCRRWVPARKKMSLRTIHDWLIRVLVSHRVSNLQRWRCGKGRSCWTKLLKKSKKWWCLKSAQSG